MEQSNLQFSNPHIEKIDFRICQKESVSNELPISIEVQSKINSDIQEAIVHLNLTVGLMSDNDEVLTAFYFNGDIAADFKWKEKVKNPDKMLEVSGGTVLLSYIRPILSNLTGQAGLKPLNLPFVNFTK